MKTSPLTRSLAGVAAVAGILALLAAGCSPQEKKAGAEGRGRTYTVRGQVTQLPDPRNPGSGLYVSHEAIDDYIGRSGEMEGMDPMNMPFLVADGVSLEGVAPGDKVEFDLYVDWQAERAVEIVALRELPPDTQLVFRAAEPAKQTKNDAKHETHP